MKGKSKEDIARSLEGYYKTSFFEMNCPVPKSDEPIQSLSDDKLSTFFHEYIHYIQDFTTMYGLHRLYVASEYIHYAANVIYKGPKRFNVPIEPIDDDSNVYKNSYIAKLVYGDYNNTIDSFTIKNIYTDNNIVDDKHNIKGVIVKTNEGDKITFGSYAISESMAYLMEQLCCKDSGNVPDFPYKTAEKIAEHCSPDFASNKLNVLALCDASLLVFNPPIQFVSFLEKVRDGKLTIKEPRDVYRYFYGMQFEGENNITMSLIQSLTCLKDMVVKDLKSYFANSKSYNDFKEFVEDLFAGGLEQRAKHCSFILQMAEGGCIRQNKAISTFIESFGSPLMSNNEMLYYSLKTNNFNMENMALFKVIYQIYRLWKKGERNCEMKEWCETSRFKVDARCSTAPWLRCNDEGPLCPYASLWKSWNLCGFEPIVTNS